MPPKQIGVSLEADPSTSDHDSECTEDRAKLLTVLTNLPSHMPPSSNEAESHNLEDPEELSSPSVRSQKSGSMSRAPSFESTCSTANEQTTIAIGEDEFPESITGYERTTQGFGLFGAYARYLSTASDVYGHTSLNSRTHDPGSFKTPNFNTVLEWVSQQLRAYDSLRSADTVIIVSDTRPLEHVKHWKHTARFLFERTKYIGPNGDKWFALYVPSAKFDAHFVWTAVYVLKALSAFLPDADLLLFDHDAAFTTLFETSQLCHLAATTSLPYRQQLTHVGCLVITEPYSPVNAGIVLFPRLPKISETAVLREVAAIRLSQILQKTDADLAAFLLTVAAELSFRTQELCRRKRAPPLLLSAKQNQPWTPASELAQPLLGEKVAMSLSWNLEAEYSLLANTPLYRSYAENRDDHILAWALLGDFMHAMFFPAGCLQQRTGHPGNLSHDLQRRKPPVYRWAGPGFEQTCLQALFALQSPNAGVSYLPGHKMFMALYMPGDHHKFLPPAMYHGFGDHAKTLISALDKFTTYFTLAEVLSPLVAPPDSEHQVMLPFFLSPEGVEPELGTKFDVLKLPGKVRPRASLEPGWFKAYEEPNVCQCLAASYTALSTASPPLLRPSWLTLTEVIFQEAAVAHPPITICCPGLRATHLPNVEPDVLLTNKPGITAYGPTAKIEENFKEGSYKQPHFPVQTLHELKLTLADSKAKSIWGFLGFKTVETAKIRPLPSFWHLPAEAYTVALMLILANYTCCPSVYIDGMLCSQAPRGFQNVTTPVSIVGFSAGSYTGMFVYRLLADRQQFHGCRFESGILGAITFHPILFYDFTTNGYRSPAVAHLAQNFRTVKLSRPKLVHCTHDYLCLWTPDDSHISQLEQIGYELFLFSGNKQARDAKAFGKCGHDYSKYLELLTSGAIKDLSQVKLSDLLDCASLSTSREELMCHMLGLVSVIGKYFFEELMLSLTTNNPLALLQQGTSLQPPLAISPHTIFLAHIRDVVTRHAPDEDKQLKLLSLSKLEEPFRRAFSHLSHTHQQWLLFFALPAAFARHSKQLEDGPGRAPSSPMLYCPAQQPCKITVEAQAGLLCYKVQLAFEVDAQDEGWAVFEPHATIALPTVAVQTYAPSRKGETKAKPLAGETSFTQTRELEETNKLKVFGLQPGDLVSFVSEWEIQESQGLQPFSLSLTGIVVDKQTAYTREQSRLNAIHYHNIKSLTLLVSFAPTNNEHEASLRSFLTRTGLTPCGQEVDLSQLQKPLVRALVDNPQLLSKEWRLIKGRFAPTEWPALASLEPAIQMLMFQPNDSEYAKPPPQVHSTAHNEFFPVLQALIQQFASNFADSSDKHMHLAEVLEHYSLTDTGHDFRLVKNFLSLHGRAGTPNLRDSFITKRYVWLTLTLVSPRFAKDFAKALADRYEVVLALMSHVEAHRISGRRACLIQGLFGSGKTFTTTMFVFLSTLFTPLKVLWVSKNNKPLEECASCLSMWSSCSLVDSLVDSLPILFKRILALRHSPTFPGIDISAKEAKQLNWDSLRCLVITSTCFADRCHTPFSRFESFAANIDLFVLDEAQQFGSATDAWICSIVPASALILLIGDQQQPIGAGNTELLQKMYTIMQNYKPGLLNSKCSPRPMKAYLQQLDLSDADGMPLNAVHSFREAVDVFATGGALPPVSNNEQHMGLSCPGPLFLPVSVRVPHHVYQPVCLIAYPKQLVSCQFTDLAVKQEMPDCQELEPTQELDPVPASCREGLQESEDGLPTCWDTLLSAGPDDALASRVRPTLRSAVELQATHSCTVSIGVPCTLDTLPLIVRAADTSSATCEDLEAALLPTERTRAINTRYSEVMRNFANTAQAFPEEDIFRSSPLRYGTYIFPYQDSRANSGTSVRNAKSDRSQSTWLHKAKAISLDIMALMIFSSLTPSHEQSFTLGFLSPWKCINDFLTDHFKSPALVDSGTNKAKNVLEAVTRVCNKPISAITLEDVRVVLARQAHMLAHFMVIGTSISSASANVRHAIAFVPKHTTFTAEFQQSVVACTRATGVFALVCPMVCKSGFFRTFIPCSLKLGALVPIETTGERWNLQALRAAFAATNPPPAFPWTVTFNLHLHTSNQLDLGHLPLALLVKVSDDTGHWKTRVLHLMVSPAKVSGPIPSWVKVMEGVMYCWKQGHSVAEENVQPNKPLDTKRFLLLQYSLATRLPILTLYLATSTHRQPIASFSRVSPNGVLKPIRTYTNLWCTITQAYPHEFLFPLTSWYCDNQQELSLSLDPNNSEETPDEEKETDQQDTNPAGTRAGDEDGEQPAENVEGVDRLLEQLKSQTKSTIKAELWFSLSNLCDPVGWGAIRFDLFKVGNAVYSTLLTRAVLSLADDPEVSTVPGTECLCF